MATTKQVQAAKQNIKKARAGAEKKRSIANLPAKTKDRQELYDEAKRRNLPGRSKMGRAELARALGHD